MAETFTATFDVTEPIPAYQLVATDKLGPGKLRLASSTDVDRKAIGMVTTAYAMGSQSVTITTEGVITNLLWNWTVGPNLGEVYLGPMPSATNLIQDQLVSLNPLQQVGTVLSPTSVYFQVDIVDKRGATGPAGVAGPTGPAGPGVAVGVSGNVPFYDGAGAVVDSGQTLTGLATDAETAAAVAAHAADAALHLTAGQNTLLDGLAPTLTFAELNFVDGVTSPIQTQLDAKYDEIVATTGDVATFGSSGAVLVDSGVLLADLATDAEVATAVSTHASDVTIHLTGAQNTFLDALALATLTAAEVNQLDGNVFTAPLIGPVSVPLMPSFTSVADTTTGLAFVAPAALELWITGSPIVVVGPGPAFTYLGSTVLSVADIGVTVQAWDADLDALALTGYAANGLAAIPSKVTVITDADDPYTMLASDEIILADASGGAITVIAPTASLGRRATTKKTDSSINAVTFDPPGGVTVDGALTFVLATQYDALSVVADGTNWHVI